MTIWFQKYTLDEISARGKGTMLEHLGIVFTKVTEDSLIATLPVDHRTKQPIGLLHGGASVVLAETIGSTAANLCVDSKKFLCVGMEINANHIRSVAEGMVTGTAKPVHLGRATQVWEIQIMNQDKKLVCISRLTMAVLGVEKS